MTLLASFREEPALRWPGIALVGLLAMLLIAEWLLTIAVAGVRSGGSSFPMWLPTVGSIGETLVFYSTLFDILKFVVIPAVILWLAYQYGRHTIGN
jgi:uncharacterized membrane protein YhdT